MKTLATANNYKYIRDINVFYGESNGYYFYSEETQYVSLIRLFFAVDNKPGLKESLDKICDRYRAVSHDGVRIEPGKIVLEIRPQGFTNPQELNELIEGISAELKKQNIQQGGGLKDIGLYRIGTHLVVQSAEAIQSQSKNLSQTFKKQSVSPLKGYLMAFVYMIPAIILYAIVMNFGFVFSILGFLIILQALRGFDKYGGTPSRTQLYVLMGFAYVGMMIARIIMIAYASWGFPFFSLTTMIKHMDYIGLIGDVLPSFLIACAFNYQRISLIFSGARTSHNVNRSIKKLL